MTIKATLEEINFMIDKLRLHSRFTDAALLSSDLFHAPSYADYLMIRDNAERLTSDLPS